MSIACPYCKAVLTPKGLKPGRYSPKCPKCNNPFIIIVPANEKGTIAVQQLVKKPVIPDGDTVRVAAVKPPVAPTTDKLPAASSLPPPKSAPPGALTEKISKISGPVSQPPERPPTSPSDAETVTDFTPKPTEEETM